MKRVLKVFFGLVISVCAMSVGAQDRIWVHIKHLGNYINSLCFVTGPPIMTGHMKLFDANRNELTIEPYGCIDLGTYSMSCPNGMPWRTFSAWEIDQISRTTPPTRGEICDNTGSDALGNPRCLPAWYPVDIPDGFHPVEYIAGCSTYLPFDFETCTYTIFPTGKNYVSTGGSQTIDINVSDSSCDWTATESLEWISLSSTGGKGNGTVVVTASANTGAARNGTITIAGKIFSVSQEAAICPECMLPVIELLLD